MTDQLTPGQLLDAAYRERAHLVAWLAAEYPAVIVPAADVDEPGWQIVYLTIGGRQASWHIAPRDADLFAQVEHVAAGDRRAQWDGHTTDEKYARIRELTAGRAQRAEVEVERLHAAQMATLGELAKAWGRRRRYRLAWRSAQRRALRLRAELGAADEEWRRQAEHTDATCEAVQRRDQAEAAVERVRRYCDLTADSCRVHAAQTARDVLQLLDGQRVVVELPPDWTPAQVEAWRAAWDQQAVVDGRKAGR